MKKIEQFYITELTLAGFKNYLEPTTFVFGNPTVITGGNGQGKSTLADAVAFAVTGLPFFGERGIDRLYNDAMKQQMELSVRLRFVDQDGAAHELYRLRKNSRMVITYDGYDIRQTDLTAGWTEAEFDAQIENTRSQITELREKISDAIIYISKRTELTFAPLKLNRVAISLYDIVKSTGERKDAFRFTYQAEGCTKGRLYKCLSHSERLRAGMEVSEMVKRLTGRNYPVFADDMESIEDLSNVKPTGQVIMARVVPHAPLSVQPLQPIQASAQAQAA